MLRDQPVELLGVEAQELTVPERPHGAGADFARQQLQLTHQLTRFEIPQNQLAAMFLKSTMDEDVEGVGAVAVSQQGLPAAQRDRFECNRQLLQPGAIEA